ncbi:UMP kinase [Candidatus Vampirococcus lugosii]|uniref:Uridylate kinase n=1 Tax=Candidatus Vampirococcus lugosii TaxID=2789015 RepID=A0ABS5QP09_9BACT|nr:UMP kinase [Candidatus Vampirococcus lugosii]MBS8122378.1 uridylate kinase (PyrH) [Candidatus Vampirococcus lugosii]
MGKYKSKIKRILFKLSGEALQGEKEYGIDVNFLQDLAKKLVYLSKYKGLQIIIVIGGGNIFRGVSGASNGLDRSQADYMGMLATIMNGIALGDAIETNGNEVRIMSALDIPKVAETFVRRRALKHLEKGRIVISVAGSGNPYYTTDSAAVLRALELDCDFMVKGTKVDGIYDKDPEKFDNAKKYENITLSDALGKGLKIMDQSAIALAKDEKLPIFVCKINDIEKILSKNIKGTYVDID